MMKPAAILFLLFCTLAGAEQTRVRVEGLRGKSEMETLQLLGGRLAHVKASPASAPRADDAAFLLRQALRKDGHAEAEVDWKITGNREITLIVREGRRLSLGTVTVQGVDSDETKRFSKLYAQPAEKDRPILLGTPPFREADVATGLSNIVQELNARGHWSARAEVTQRSQNPRSGAVDLVIDVEPGPVFVIARPVIESTESHGVDLGTRAVEPFTGRKATTKNLNAMRAAVEQSAVSLGYPDANIRMSRGPQPDVFAPVFSITLGTRVKLRKLSIDGLERTDPARIARRMAGMEGDWYDEHAVNKRLRELLATGAFSSANVETTEAGDRLVDATLHFEEAKAREMSFAAGFGSYQGFIGRATYADRNLFGNLWGFSSGFEVSSRGLLGDVRVTDPWVMGMNVSATARAYALLYNREGYDSYDTGIEGSATWKPGDHYQIELLAGNSVINARSDGLPTWALGETLYTRPRLRLNQKIEFRDSAVLPKNGWHLEGPVEFGSAIGGVSTSYASAGLKGGWFQEIGRKYQLGLGGEWGMLVPDSDGADLPIDLRLFNGGSRSVRSFPERELGPEVNGFPIGGEAMWNANAELSREVAGPLRAVLFFDAGSLARNHEELAGAEVELATGIGVRLNLPIGPVRVEYGYNLTRDPGEPNGTFHFAIGHAY